LRTLLGLQPALGGRVALDDTDLTTLARRDIARAIGYVPQSPADTFDFTVAETVEMGRVAHLAAFQAPGRRDREAVSRALALLRIGPLAPRPMSALSGGERQLALNARAHATEASHLLMDEPTANLDFGNQSLILDEVARLRAAGAAVLFTTHHPDQALRIADRAILLKAGEILAQGPTAATVNSENLSALYGRGIDVVEIKSPDGLLRRTCMAREAPGFD
jgi:iron complex transport system ATP-binding protein